MSFINKRIQFLGKRKNGRTPSNWPYDGSATPLRITRLFPMKLKDVTVSELQESKKESDVVCIQEMMSLLDCFEKHDFNSSICEQQSKNLENCYTTHLSKRTKPPKRWGKVIDIPKL